MDWTCKKALWIVEDHICKYASVGVAASESNLTRWQVSTTTYYCPGWKIKRGGRFIFRISILEPSCPSTAVNPVTRVLNLYVCKQVYIHHLSGSWTCRNIEIDTHHIHLSPLVKPHSYVVANVIDERSSKPLERLAPILLPAPLANVKRMCCNEPNVMRHRSIKGSNAKESVDPADILTNCKSIHGKEEEVNSVKQLVWNRVTKERRTSHEQLVWSRKG